MGVRARSNSPGLWPSTTRFLPSRKAIGCDRRHRFPSPPLSNVLHHMLYAPGESVLITGCYEAIHMEHRPPHQVWLLFNEEFPRCRHCGAGVIFKLVRRATEPICDLAGTDEDFAAG